MQTADLSFYAPHCSSCFQTFAETPLKAACGHLFCRFCVDPGYAFVCPYDKRTTNPDSFQSCEDVQTLFLRLLSDDFDEVLDAIYEEINTTGVPCKCVREHRACEDLSRCRYLHGTVSVVREEEDLMKSMEPVFPEEDFIKDYIVVEKGDETDSPNGKVQLFEYFYHFYISLKSKLEGLMTREDLSSSHYD